MDRLTRLLQGATPLALIGGIALLLHGCEADTPTASSPGTPAYAAGGGGGPDPVVRGVDPTEAPQDTTLDVHVFGDNFEDGAVVTLKRNGKASRKVKTNSTNFVSSSEVVANITIAVDAETGSYDVEVALSRKRKGVGTELFEVKEPHPLPASADIPLIVTARDDAGDKVTSDTAGEYVDGVEEVSTNIAGDFGQFGFTPTAEKAFKPLGPRRVCLVFDEEDPMNPEDPPFLRDCPEDLGWNVTRINFLSLANGETATARSRILFVDNVNAIQYWLRWGTDDPANRVTVVRLDQNTWTVEAGPELVATLEKAPTKGRFIVTRIGEFSMPFKLTLRRKGPP